MLRVKVELVPHGVEPLTETLDELVIVNDGTGHGAVGPDSGGFGNYDVYADAQRLLHIGRIECVERTESHRVELARRALELLEKERGVG